METDREMDRVAELEEQIEAQEELSEGFCDEISELETLIKAHKVYKEAQKVFMEKTGIELCGFNHQNIHLFENDGDSFVPFMNEIGGVSDKDCPTHIKADVKGVEVLLITSDEGVKLCKQ